MKEVTIKEANINAGAMFDFVGVFKDLKSFHYEPCNYLEDSKKRYHIFDPSLIRNALLAHARESLKHLILRARLRPRTYMGRLRNFLALCTLETDWALLVATNYAFEDLADAVPFSIEQVNLHTDDTFELRNSTFQIKSLLQMKEERFPSLEKLHILDLGDSTGEAMDTKLMSIAQAQDVHLILDTTPDPDAPWKSCVWDSRRFHARRPPLPDSEA